MLIETDIFGNVTDKVAVALERIDALTPTDEPLWVAFSGGKDSQVILDLVRRSGRAHEAHFSITTVDPPELVSFIRREYPDVKIDLPKTSMRKLIVKNGYPPTRMARYCCAELKERGGEGRYVILGIRWAESARRSSRKMVEVCAKSNRRLLCPIIDWSDAEVWEYIKGRGLPYCRLYDEGRKRIGCVCCPMATKKKMLADAERWPGIHRMYMKAFAEMIQTGKARTWKTPEEVFEWWTRAYGEKENPDQICFIFE